ncbi:MAG: hypothetical protein JWP25_5182 [Bradyrhizobium sp.]|nr:hypothetical protein [Bradyrhizobium sp.]
MCVSPPIPCYRMSTSASHQKPSYIRANGWSSFLIIFYTTHARKRCAAGLSPSRRRPQRARQSGKASVDRTRDAENPQSGPTGRAVGRVAVASSMCAYLRMGCSPERRPPNASTIAA